MPTIFRNLRFRISPEFRYFSRNRHELLLALKRMDVRYLVPSSKKNDVPARRLNFQPDPCHASLSCSSTYSKTRNYILEKVLTVSISLSHRLVPQRTNYRALSEICYLALQKLETSWKIVLRTNCE